jgi:hypothetical protein
MPCYQVNNVSLDFQAGSLDLLQKAAAVLGLEVRVIADRREVVDCGGAVVATLVGGKATCAQANVAVVNKLRVQYSREIVGHAAVKLGWQKIVKSDNKLLLRKGC